MKFTKFVVSAAAALFVLPASAALITINGISPAWVNPAPVVAINNGGDPITARWGSPVGGAGQSGYDFNDSPTPVVVDTAVNSGRFLLGTFTHRNQPITGTTLASIGLSVTVDIMLGVPGSFNEIFTLFHDETPNDCTGMNCANDIVTFGAGTLNSSFTVGGQSYVLRLLGFSNNGGATLVSSFSSVEGGNNSTGLYAQITARPTAVPEPATLLLMGAGLVSLAFVRRRRQQR